MEDIQLAKACGLFSHSASFTLLGTVDDATCDVLIGGESLSGGVGLFVVKEQAEGATIGEGCGDEEDSLEEF